MKKSVIEFENHFENKTTLVFQYNNEKYIINGCQIFLEKEKDVVFKCFNVGKRYKNDVNEALTLLNYNVNENDLLYIVKTYPNFIEYIEHEDQTYEMALYAVKRWVGNILYINEDLQDYNMAMVVVKDWSRYLQYIRKDLQDNEMVLMAVKHLDSNLQYVREDLQTEELCKIAIKQSYSNINFIKCPVMKNKFEISKKEIL